MILLGLSGRLHSGKDTSFGFVQEWAAERGLRAVRRGFADKMKVSGMRALGFVGTDDDLIMLANELKEMGEVSTVILSQSVLYTIEGRKFWQLYGTEAHRDVFGSDFWVDALLPTDFQPNYGDGPVRSWEINFCQDGTEPGSIGADIAVVTDVRFENEAERIKHLDGHLAEIIREEPDPDGNGHISEAGIPGHLVDYVIDNTTTLENLRDEVFYVMDEIYSKEGHS